MQLYTVKMTTKQIVSRFDDKGAKISESEILIPVTYTDLPLQTAQMYRSKNPDGNVQIIAQQAILNSARARPGQYASTGERRERKQVSSYVPSSKPASKSAPKPSAVQNAAQSGDLSAAINHR